jgi:antitoxin component YwqK of YwqJK toxin-antitoxin module
MPMVAQSSNRHLLTAWRRRQTSAGVFAVIVSLAIPYRALPAEPKVIQERYPNGGLHIEREVTVDADGSVMDDGCWRKWNPAGKLIVEGNYAKGKRVGAWSRWLGRDEAELLFTAPFDQFEPPFVSRADFIDGQMDGQWTISDAHGQLCSLVVLKNGKRHGPATLRLPDGRIFREVHFTNGLPSGDLREIGHDGQLRTTATYDDGRQLVNNVTHFPGSENKHIEATFMTALVSQRSPDDYAELRFAQYAVRRKFARHGTWRSWYTNGQLQCEGNFASDRESGRFTWWHANGTLAAEGCVVDGRPEGSWTWWFANGQKAAEAQFTQGQALCPPTFGEQSGETPISATFAPKGRAAVTRKNRQLY